MSGILGRFKLNKFIKQDNHDDDDDKINKKMYLVDYQT